MTSQKSTNKKSVCLISIMREDFRHKTWMLALSILGNLLAGPVAALYYIGRMNISYERYVIKGNGVYNQAFDYVMNLSELTSVKYDDCLQYLTRVFTWAMLIIAVGGALIVGLQGFRFLFQKRSVDLFHSIPVSRRKLFTATWLNGFLLWLVPASVGSILVFAFFAFFMKGAFCAALFGKIALTLLGLSLCFLITYHVCLVGVMLSGNTVNAVVVSLILGLIVAASSTVLYALQYCFYENYYVPSYLYYANPLYVLSPMLTPFVLAVHWSTDSIIVPTYYWHLFAGTLLMVINLFLACHLYVKRRSELAERGLEAKPVRILSRAIISILSGSTFAIILREFDDSRSGWMVFGLLLGTFLAFCVLNVIFHASFKAAFSHKIQYVITLVICCVTFFGIMFDVTGYAKKLPSKDSITGITLYAGALSSSSAQYVMEDGFLRRDRNGIDWGSPIHCTDADQIYALLSACVSEKADYNYIVYVIAKVHTKWGTYYRSYNVSQNDLRLLEPIIEKKEYLEENYPMESLCFGYPETITISSSLMTERRVLDQAQITQLVNALHQDFEDHHTVKDLLRTSRAFSLHMYYPRDNKSYVNVYVDVPYWYENTIGLVSEWYPKKNWDPSLDEIVSMDVSNGMDVRRNEDFLTVLFRKYGYDAQGNPLPEAPVERYEGNWEEGNYSQVYWNFSLTDVEFLKELEPYLIWGYYSDPLTSEYAFLGSAHLEDGGTADCYVRYGTLPVEILGKIAENANYGYYYEDAEKIYYD